MLIYFLTYFVKNENFYLYGAVEPMTGQSFFLEMPLLNGSSFQLSHLLYE